MDISEEDGAHVIRYASHGGKTANLEHGLWNSDALQETWTISQTDPGAASVHSEWSKWLGRGDWQVGTDCVVTMHRVAGGFDISAELSAFEGGELLFQRSFVEFFAD